MNEKRELSTEVAPALAEKPDKVDLFGLEADIEKDTEASRILFDRCDGLVKEHIRGSAVDEAKYLSGEKLELPVQDRKGKKFRLTRQASPQLVTYSFERADLAQSLAGFQVARNTIDQTTILTNLSARQAEHLTDDEYSELIEHATGYINIYARFLKHDPRQLLEYAKYKIMPPQPPATKFQKVGQTVFRVLAAPFSRPDYQTPSGEIAPFKWDGAGNVRLNKRHFSFLRLALTGLLAPLPGYSQPIIPGSGVPIDNPSLMQLYYNQHDAENSRRASYDRLNIELPASLPTLRVGETQVLEISPSLPDDLLYKLSKAPAVSAESSDSQPLYGGPRQIKDLGNDDHMWHGKYLAINDCDIIHANIQPQDSVRVAGITPLDAGNLEFSITLSGIRICNNTRANLDPTDLQGVIVQVIPSQK